MNESIIYETGSLISFLGAVIISIMFLRWMNRHLIVKKKDTKRKKGVTEFDFIFKKNLMTKSEREFFMRLERIYSDEYYIFPQIHLSSILNEKIKGQNWKIAFNYINNWSVDYVLCDKTTLETIYAVELDGDTHSREDRIIRDQEKNEILAKAGVPLVRFSDVNNLSDANIIQKFYEKRTK